MSTAAWPDHLLTLAEWEAMPEDATHRLELVEGILLVAPRPTGRHQYAMSELSHALNRQLRPKGLIAMADVEVVIEPGFPPSVRVPDVIVVAEAVAKPDPPRYAAADVVLAVEVVSPGSGLTDRVTKRIQYAEAGIAHYWIIDLDAPVSLAGYLLVDQDYEVTVDGTGVVDVTSPAPLRIELDTLVPFP